MKLRATETPSATAAAVLVPTPAEPDTASTSAWTSPVDVAVIVTLPTGFAAVPSEPPRRYALVLERIALVDSEPPPENAIAGLPPETATESATAIDLTVIFASFDAVIVTSPAAMIVPASFTNAATELSIELCASDRPTEPAPPLLPDRLAATAAACASAVMVDASLAVTDSSPLPAATPVPSADASTATPILL